MSHRALDRSPYLLAAPAALAMLALIVLPLALTLSLSFHEFAAGEIRDTWTLTNYWAVLADEYYQTIFLRTAWLAILVTLLCILIGVPEAYLLAKLSPRWRAVCLVIILGPLLISVIVRTLGWAILLGSDGIINGLLLKLGLIDHPLRLMYSFTGVVVALVHVLVPLMVLAVWASLQKIDPATEDAAASLGAGNWTILRRIIFPQVLPGVLSGSLIVFAMSASAFATPAIIGGRRLKVAATTAYDEFLSTLNWPLGSAIAVLLLIAVFAASTLLNRLVERRFKQVFE